MKEYKGVVYAGGAALLGARRSAAFAGALALAGFVPLGPAGAAPSTAPLSGTASATHAEFGDPRGDGEPGPDVTAVQVGNDLVAGHVVIWVDTPNRTSLGPSDAIVIFLDTDLSAATGQPDAAGADFVLELAGTGGAFLSRWSADESNYVQVAAPTLAAKFVPSEKSSRFSIHPRDLGGTRGFNFFIVTLTGEEIGDVAPDGSALWSFSLRPGPLQLTAGRPSLTPRAPRAGARLTATMGVARTDINEALTRGTVTCTLRVGARTLRAASSGFRSGLATCIWRLPAWVAGAQLRIGVTVAFGGAKVTRTAAVRSR